MFSRPSQGNSLHFTTSTAGPLQSFPPQDGTGLLQLLVLFLTQATEQFPTDQFDQPPSTTYIQQAIIYTCAYTINP